MEEHHGTLKLNDTLGAQFLGNLAAAVLYGITCVQTYIYFKNNYKDTLAFKFLILFLWLLDSSHMALISHGSYHYLVMNFGNISAALSPTWTMLIQIYVTVIIDVIIRAIFGRRVWLMSRRNIPLACCIAGTSGLTLVAGFTFASKAFILGTFKKFPQISYLLYAALGGGVAADILIAASLCIALSRRRTGIKKTESVINVMMMYTINTSLLTTICSAACFITYAMWPNALTFLGIYYSLGKLYFNSLLATLNSRDALLEKLGDVVMSNFSSTSSRSKSGARNYWTKRLSDFEARVSVLDIERDAV
ncbi:hypothetical protein L208DRAFT_867205 [Tricholoma matsutake]|nr:hypothetical protein L208DRAFT_867205 [Tricholoma matsutake 945]